MHGIEMDRCNLMGARLHRVSFARSFGRSVVRVAGSLTDCNLELADLAQARMPGCVLARSRLREADLTQADLEGADLTGADLFQAIVDEARLAGADLRGAEVSGLDLRRLASYDGLKVTADQQYRLLEAMGIDVHPD
jgi:fluoroquinolone resistance protein